MRHRHLIHTSSIKYSIPIGLEEAKTIPIVCAHVWNWTNRTNLRYFCSEDGVFVQKIHNLGANVPVILLAIVSMVEDCNLNDWFKKENMSVSTSTVYSVKIRLFKYIFFTLIWRRKNGHSLFSVSTINIFTLLKFWYTMYIFYVATGYTSVPIFQ